jgi:hypothetical protein
MRGGVLFLQLALSDKPLFFSDRVMMKTQLFYSGINGSKEFVSGHYRRFKNLFMSKN